MGEAKFRLSKVAQWETTDGHPLGPLSRVRCPDFDHCLRLAPYEDGRIGPHDRNMPGTCKWIGAAVVDDRHDLPARYLHTTGRVTGFRRHLWRGGDEDA
ncbi:hypothetical protein [Nocardia abscessus]|uniref:hypothetical protein n=1 Tax=Nocardia abscessus TaxID=120957 RepID=UPI002456114F|nr:hypothetical protein [Nocardia abscessus]